MSFVTAHPDALAAAAEKLATAGSALAARNASAAGPTTGVVPAAADEISVLQAAQFAAYGDLYQSIAAEAAAIHARFVQTLGASGGSYGDTDTANAGTAGSGLSGLFGGLSGAGSGTVADPWAWLTGALGETAPGGLSSNLSNIANIGAGNWICAASNLLGMAGGGLLDDPAESTAAEAGVLGAGGAAILASADETAGSAAFTGAPVVAGVAQASSVGGLSVPPGWAVDSATAAESAPARAVSTALALPAPAGGPSAPTAMPAGLPAVASARRAAGLGVPRYGAKPTVMYRPGVG